VLCLICMVIVILFFIIKIEHVFVTFSRSGYNLNSFESVHGASISTIWVQRESIKTYWCYDMFFFIEGMCFDAFLTHEAYQRMRFDGQYQW